MLNPKLFLYLLNRNTLIDWCNFGCYDLLPAYFLHDSRKILFHGDFGIMRISNLGDWCWASTKIHAQQPPTWWKQLVLITAYKLTNYGVFLVRIFSHLDWMRENTDQKNSVVGHISHCSCSWSDIISPCNGNKIQ